MSAVFGSDQEHQMARRPWTSAERRVVLRGLIGRLSIAIEPIICATIFAALTVVPFYIHLHDQNAIGAPARFSLAQILAPIFGFATVAFLAYATLVLIPPLRAFFKTFTPLFVVDGYVSYRVDKTATCPYIAVLDHQRIMLHEWKLAQHTDVRSGIFPALIEFSDFGGVHRIDGRETGVLPETFMPFGIGNYSYGSRLYRTEIK